MHTVGGQFKLEKPPQFFDDPAAPMKYAKSVAQYDLVVIGSGPGGQKAALAAAKRGKKVAIVEEHPAVGGGCVHYGTIPSKSFRESVYRWSLSSRGAIGQEFSRSRGKKVVMPDMKRLLRRRDWVVSGEAQVVFDQLKRNGVVLVHGRARFIGHHEIEVVSRNRKKEIRAQKFIIAVGASPVAPAHLPVDQKIVFDSNSILNLKRLPKSLLVLGGGIIGAEYASMFAMAGTKVTLVDKRNEILANVDREVVAQLLERFKSEGMEILLKCDAEKIEKTRKGAKVTFTSGKTLDVEGVLIALGRKGNVGGLGLETLGIDAGDRGIISVNPFYQTTRHHVYAVGDIVGPPALASTSAEQGRIAANHAFGVEVEAMSPYFPTGIYTIPEISMVGPTEEELKRQGVDFIVGRARYRELARGQIVGDRAGLLKLIADRKTLKLLAVHIVGDNAAELVHIGQAVMTFGGDLKYFICTVFNYPTHAEAYKTAAFHAINQLKGATRSD